MPQTKGTKDFHTFVGGLNTEVSPLNFPDGTAVDMANMELNVDGSISRRKGLAVESSSVLVQTDVAYTNSADAVSEHFWRNVAGTDQHIHVVQAGFDLFFWEDDATSFASGLKGFKLDLRSHLVATGTATDAQIAAEPIDFSWGRGQALVTHKYLEPFFIKFDTVTDQYTTEPIFIRIRDFVGVKSGVQITTKPSVLIDEHNYNLRNRGWRAVDIATFLASDGNYPSLNMIPYTGYARAETTGTTYDHDGVRTWDTLKIEAEGFGNGASPPGRFFVDPFTTASTPDDEVAANYNILTWSLTGGLPATGSVTFVITTPVNHGYTDGQIIQIVGQQSQIDRTISINGQDYTQTDTFSFDGTYTIFDAETASLDEFSITVNLVAGIEAWNNQYELLGDVHTTIPNSGGEDTLLRPTTNAYFAGRAWYAGTGAGVVGQHVMFSQIIEKDEQYGRCFQQNDPTSEQLPDLLESDGGIIFIPEAGRILKLQPFGQSMLILAANGVWEIDGGRNRYFDATDYAVRRITASGCISRESVIEAEDNILYASEEGIFSISNDASSGFFTLLVATNITLEKVQSKWNEIDSIHKSAVKSLYDPVKKRFLFMYDTAASPTARTWNYREVLILDTRLQAWYTYSFPVATDFATDTYVKGFAKPESYSASGEAIIKFLTWEDAATPGLQWTELSDNTDFEDLSQVDAAGYIITGHETMGGASKDKQVRYIYTFMERIEDSSFLMRGRWDFADASISGKWAPQVEAYRPPRAWVGAHDDDGYPVVVSKHTLPGQGQVLAIRYDTSPAADAVMYGWSIDFQGIQD